MILTSPERAGHLPRPPVLVLNGAFVENGAIAPVGRLVVNTNGGGLSCCHPGMYGIFPLIEAVRQLRGDCGERQQASPEIALAHGNGGLFSSQVTLILGTDGTL